MARDHDDDHAPDGGFVMDMTRMIGRRHLLAALGLGGAAALAFRMASAQEPQTGTAADGSICTVPDRETAGPYPGDGTNARAGQTVNVLGQGGVERSDITRSFGGYSGAAEGVPLVLDVSFVNVNAACLPVQGLAFYLWHCDAAGEYSLYTVPEANWLRGVQISDGQGRVRFATVLPGCYDGRWPHMHFEVFRSTADAVSGRQALLTSQFALPQDVIAPIYATDPRYSASVANLKRITLATDNVFRDNSAAAMQVMTLAMSGDGTGLAAAATVGLAL